MKRSILFLMMAVTTVVITQAQPLNTTTPFISLPVTLTSFTAVVVDGSTHVNWQTTQEVNSHVFEVEHSSDGTQWIKLGSVKAANNSALTHDYSFIHTQPGPGKNYYRLKMIDRDGSFELSQAIYVTIKTPAGIRLYPVPVVDYLKVEVTGFGEALPYTILNSKGKEMKHGVITQNNQRITIPDLPAGLYFFRTERFGAIKFIK